MSAGLVLILVVVGAYVAAHLASEWLARRFLIVSGAEYLLLGILLGPQVSGMITATTVGDFAPFMTLAFGWIGALVGAQFRLPELMRIPRVMYRVAWLEAVFSLAGVAGIMAATLAWWFGLESGEVVRPAIVLGAIAVASAPAGIALTSRSMGQSGPMIRQLSVATAIDAVVAITTFGLLLAITHTEPPSAVRPPTATEWVVVSIAVGLLGGILFHLFLGPERKVDRLFIALAGALILTSGAAAYMRLSPLLPAMLVGAVLVNTSHSSVEIRQVLAKVERPLYFVLLIFAGAAWQPSSRGWLVPVAVLLLARMVGKLGAARLAARWTGVLPALGPTWGMGLLGHGGLAIAIALNYHLHESSALSNVVFTAAIVSVFLSDVFSARVVRSLVRAYGVRVRGAARRLAQSRTGQGAA
ncbi:MAG TPA: hypothetical protein VIL18_04405 [Longimicrobiales bacterium]